MGTLESPSLDETIRCALKWFILTRRTQNLEFVNLKCVTYTQHIPLPLNSLDSRLCIHVTICSVTLHLLTFSYTKIMPLRIAAECATRFHNVICQNGERSWPLYYVADLKFWVGVCKRVEVLQFFFHVFKTILIVS